MQLRPEQQLIDTQDSLSDAHVLGMQVPFSHFPSKQQSLVVLHAALIFAHFTMPQIPS
jgi:hypothetical protein